MTDTSVLPGYTTPISPTGCHTNSHTDHPSVQTSEIELIFNYDRHLSAARLNHPISPTGCHTNSHTNHPSVQTSEIELILNYDRHTSAARLNHPHLPYWLSHKQPHRPSISADLRDRTHLQLWQTHQCCQAKPPPSPLLAVTQIATQTIHQCRPQR